MPRISAFTYALLPHLLSSHRSQAMPFIQLQNADGPDRSVPSDLVSLLEGRISAGEVKLSFDPDWGYLP